MDKLAMREGYLGQVVLIPLLLVLAESVMLIVCKCFENESRAEEEKEDPKADGLSILLSQHVQVH